MKVAMIAPYANALVGGGAIVQLQSTASRLKNYGVEVVKFDPWERADERNYDLIHIFGANATTYDLAIRLAELEIPYVVSPIFFTLRKPGFVRLARRTEKFIKKYWSGVWTDYGIITGICAGAAYVLPNTGEEAEIIEKGLEIDPRKIEIIPNGVEKRFEKSDPSLFVELHGIKDFILYVGNIGSKRKNVLKLIRALKEIDHPAVFIGKIHRNGYARECIAEAKKSKNILFVDSLSHDSDILSSAYAACRIFVLPSYFETPGISALEAALAGAGIVITKHGGTREYFIDYAHYVDPDSIDSIRNGVENALNSPVSEKLKERIKENYLWERAAEKSADVYRRILKR